MSYFDYNLSHQIQSKPEKEQEHNHKSNSDDQEEEPGEEEEDEEEDEQEVEVDMDEYFKENLKNQIKLKSLSRANSEKKLITSDGVARSNSLTSSLTTIPTGGSAATGSGDSTTAKQLIQMSDEDIENLKLDSKLKTYQLNLSKSAIPEQGSTADEQQTKSSTSFINFSRPQFRVPFFFK